MQENNAYRVLARKYRPQNFDDLIGQEPMVRTLSNAFKTGRIAQAYMLTGVRGVGKTTTARILARALNYELGDIKEPTIDLATEGDHCKAIMEGRHVDIIEMDAASHTGIDDIRDIIESVQYAPALARYKVYIIDEVHMLSRNAFNGLLKTLEEPPAHLKFIFATTEIRKVPITVLSRCQRFDLRRIDSGMMVAHLQKIAEAESVEADVDALGLIARASEGSVRDALSMFDQAIAHSAGRVEAENIRSMLGLADRARVIDLFENVMTGNIAGALGEMKEQYDTGADPYVVLTDLADFIHYVTRLKYATEDGPGAMMGEGSALSENERKRGKEYADKLSIRILGRTWQILLKGLAEVRSSERALAAADMVLVRLTHAADLPSHEELVKQIQQPVAGQSPSASATMPQGSGSATSAVSNTPNVTHAPPVSAPISFQSSPSQVESADIKPVSISQSGSQALAPHRQKDLETDDQPPLILNSFEELIFLTEDKRDIKTKTYLRRNVRLVEFKSGYFEFNQVGNASRESLQLLKQQLEIWTHIRWNIVISDKEGLPTLEEIEAAEKDNQMEKARSHPAVTALMKAFDGARIVDVRIKEPEVLGLAPVPEEDTDEIILPDDGLDDFYE
ncbi:MAG: DNA polymerase III subunit gamma/tau [Salaquimonas sp.]